ncbi:uncharacterized protein LOC100823429 [Brachypodium distachyon]|uniref:DUF4220 domain-containing protein n=1 Tax=Brachypodium distachyon TaxID=15368 RepID=I1H497_BRADI|nr:uncharacterized protein LOC100823429 [Brachypodium distachyon]PNT77192.1 hypothetical protein BRADI_1g58970v3 [Brachypodium distachyon]PNT77193.1 hypothetical protein BRADI_1g58970v3 [Brachypodium distachyon]|eukprot:XP_014752001.1 uncharacterized protein LOC100823429 [Brachypodium distachyon]
MAEASTTIIVQLFIGWEIQLLILLSFALQLFLFFFGGLRRRNHNGLLSLLLWLAFLSADYIAVYALGYLSRHLPNTTTNDAKLISQARSSQMQLLWAPFLLIHLGGQDTVTAFSIEDNELWLRHLLNLLVQVCLVLRVLWNSLAYDPLVLVLTIFLFVTGIIKYGERIWALKCGSQKALKSSNRSEVVKQLPEHQDATELTYPTVVKYALHSERGLRDVFAGRKFYNTGVGDEEGYDTYRKFLFRGREDAELDFKRVEVELTIMYDDLFTKAGVIQTRLGTVLRCVSLISTMLAFVLFIMMRAKQRYGYTGVDAAITYVLFIGAFCLEACAVMVVIMSPRAWAILEARCPRLGRVSWYVLVRMQPKTRPWWSNSIGQYNLLNSCMADKKSSTVIAKMISAVGATDLWNNIRHTKHVKVTTGTKKLIHQLISWEWNRPVEGLHRLGQHLSHDSMRRFKPLFKLPFEEALFVLHVLTDVMIYRAGMPVYNETGITEEMQGLMDTCKGMSDYMFYLLVENPDMLPVSSRARDLLTQAFESLKASSPSSKEQFLEEFSSKGHGILTDANHDKIHILFQKSHRLLMELGFHEAFQMLGQVWVRLLVYAAGKSRPEEHARRLSMGGELLTFVWLLMAHRELGDVCYEVNLIQTKQSGVFLFD